LQEDLGIVRQHVAPARAIAAGVERRGDDAKVLRLPVRADQHALVQIFDLILVPGLARHDDAEIQRRIAGPRVAPLGNRRAFHADVQVTLRLAACHDEIEAFVGFFVHEPIRRHRRTEYVRAHAPTQQRHGILLDIQQRAVVVGPSHVGLGVLDHVAEQLTAGDILEADPVLAPAHDVLGIREQPVVRARFVAAELKKLLTDGEHVAVEQDEFGRVGLVRPAEDRRVLLAAAESTRIPVPAIAHRHARIVLLDAANDLAIQLVDQRLRWLQHRFGVGSLGPQMLQHLRIAARVVAQPVEGVFAGAEGGRYPMHERCRIRRSWHLLYIARAGLDGKSAAPQTCAGKPFSVWLLGSSA
jgi:hypothetical protein